MRRQSPKYGSRTCVRHYLTTSTPRRTPRPEAGPEAADGSAFDGM